jgi:hypothetical protein
VRKKLWVLNLLLLVAVGLVARELRNDWKAAREREKKILQKDVKTSPAPPMPQTPSPAPVQAAAYLDVAQQNLFSKDRNPNIVIEAEKPKPLPAFPRFYGVMNLGDGAMAILSDSPGRQRPFKTGDKVGEFLLAEIGTDTLVFEWEKQKLTKKFSELQDRSEQSTETTRSSAPAAGPAAAAPVQRPVEPAKPGPGTDMGSGLAACNPNDPTPAGTVLDGKRKVVTDGMFGKVCRWEPVR